VNAGHTEVILNSRNPHWTKPILIPYKFEERQLLRFQVYYKSVNHEEVWS
jgi:hypothetical protein